MFDLTGKTAVVTGGSRGIGRAICLKLAGQGANIVLNFAGNEAAAEETRSQCEALGVKALAVKGAMPSSKRLCLNSAGWTFWCATPVSPGIICSCA